MELVLSGVLVIAFTVDSFRHPTCIAMMLEGICRHAWLLEQLG